MLLVVTLAYMNYFNVQFVQEATLNPNDGLQRMYYECSQHWCMSTARPLCRSLMGLTIALIVGSHEEFMISFVISLQSSLIMMFSFKIKLTLR